MSFIASCFVCIRLCAFEALKAAKPCDETCWRESAVVVVVVVVTESSLLMCSPREMSLSLHSRKCF